MPVSCIVCQQPLADHEQQTCTHCVTTARRNLIDIEHDYELLEAEMLDRAGAATPPDPTGVRTDTEPMLGGDILVMLAPGSTGMNQIRDLLADRDASHIDDEHPGDVQSVVGELGAWEDEWRRTFRELAAQEAPSISGVTLYLLRHLAKAAAEHPTFDEFHRHVQEMRQWLTAALRNGPQRSPVPCIQCGRRTLERPMPRPDGQEFEWQCSHCHRNYDVAGYLMAMRESGQAV